jgi:cysteinyl-tRNA synthetase
MFPHHENEIAQSCCAHQGAGFANIWMHNEMLQVEGKKMSKSLGNFFTVRDLLDQGVPGEVIRFVMLSTHYSKPMDWTAKKAAEAEKTLRKWYAQAANAPQAPVPDAMLAALSDDLNTPLGITALHQISQSGDAASLHAGLAILGLASVGVPDWVASPDVDLSALEAQLFAVRQTAMETKDFAPVDALKSALTDAGVEVRMSKEGVELIPTANFDPLKLEGLL